MSEFVLFRSVEQACCDMGTFRLREHWPQRFRECMCVEGRPKGYRKIDFFLNAVLRIIEQLVTRLTLELFFHSTHSITIT